VHEDPLAPYPIDNERPIFPSPELITFAQDALGEGQMDREDGIPVEPSPSLLEASLFNANVEPNDSFNQPSPSMFEAYLGQLTLSLANLDDATSSFANIYDFVFSDLDS
jgi:hypothetical protein